MKIFDETTETWQEKDAKGIYDNGLLCFIKVTPRIARIFLERNHNRRIRAGKVRELRNAMIEGKFCPANDLICFDADGILMNGQHRLEGIAQNNGHAENSPPVLAVRFGTPRPEQEMMDSGTKRNLHDVCTLADVPIDAFATRIARFTVNHTGVKSKSVGRSEEVAFVRKYCQELNDVSKMLKPGDVPKHKLPPVKLGNDSASALFRAYCYYKAAGDSSKVQRLAMFIKGFSSTDFYADLTNSGNPSDNAFSLLAKRLTETKLETGQVGRNKRYRLTERAIRAFVEREPLTRLRTGYSQNDYWEELFPLEEDTVTHK